MALWWVLRAQTRRLPPQHNTVRKATPSSGLYCPPPESSTLEFLVPGQRPDPLHNFCSESLFSPHLLLPTSIPSKWAPVAGSSPLHQRRPMWEVQGRACCNRFLCSATHSLQGLCKLNLAGAGVGKQGGAVIISVATANFFMN